MSCTLLTAAASASTKAAFLQVEKKFSTTANTGGDEMEAEQEQERVPVVTSMDCKYVWVVWEIARFVMLVWHDSGTCIAWQPRAPFACHANTQGLMRNRYATQKLHKKTCHAWRRNTVWLLFSDVHHNLNFPDRDIIAVDNQQRAANVGCGPAGRARGLHGRR